MLQGKEIVDEAFKSTEISSIIKIPNHDDIKNFLKWSQIVNLQNSWNFKTEIDRAGEIIITRLRTEQAKFIHSY